VGKTAVETPEGLTMAEALTFRYEQSQKKKIHHLPISSACRLSSNRPFPGNKSGFYLRAIYGRQRERHAALPSVE
jgi:hypothetical protein